MKVDRKVTKKNHSIGRIKKEMLPLINKTYLKHKKIIICIFFLFSFLLIIFIVYLFFIEPITFTPLSFRIPAFTKTKLGIPGDPVDLLIVGDENAIKQDFKKAHWLIPDTINKKTTEKIIKTAIKNTSYPTAPVSNLYIYKRKEDLAFELPTQTVRKRHHIRLWLTTYNIANKPVWIGVDTYDSSIELSHTDLFPTHHVDSDIDKERDFLVNTLSQVQELKTISQQKLTWPILFGFNGNGDWYHDSGIIDVLILR